MPLSILLPLVVGGITLIAVILHLLGLSRRRRFDSPEDASAAWLREFPDTPPIEAILARDGHAALIQTRQGPGLVWAIGADTVARPLKGADILAAKSGLTVHFHDIAAPVVHIPLSPHEIPRWQEWMIPT